MDSRWIPLLLVVGIGLGTAACDGDDNDGNDNPVEVNQRVRATPPSLASATQIDTVQATAILPLYRGLDASGNSVYYVLTETNNVDEAMRLGINWAPKMVHAMRTKATQTVTVTSNAGRRNANDFPVVRFAGNVDFSPTRRLVPGPQGFPLDTASRAGSVGDAMYTPLITFDDTIVYNAPHIANGTGLHDRVISLDTANMQVRLQLVKGFYEGFPTLYLSTDVTDEDLSALEQGTFAPNLNFAPFPGDDKPFRSAREAIVPIVNGPRGSNNPDRQGLASAAFGEGDPFNIFQEQARCDNADDPAAFCDAVLYSPLWDAHPVMWTEKAINEGVRDRLTTDKREIIAPLNVIDLHADGHLVSLAVNGPRNATLGGIHAAGIVINCPIIFMPTAAR